MPEYTIELIAVGCGDLFILLILNHQMTMKTPETEAVLGLYNETVTKDDLVLAHFARRLERERNEAREDLTQSRQKLEAIAIGLSPASMAIHCGGDCSKIPGSLANLILECGAIAASGNSRMNIVIE